MIVKEPAVFFTKKMNELQGAIVKKTQKMGNDVQDLYQYSDGSNDEKVAYTVYHYATGDSHEVGNLNYGLSVLEPLNFQGEYNMTRGHFHENKECAEFYWCIAGEGLLLLMDESGETWAEELYCGSVHRIEGDLGHRLVNTGETQLILGACWSPGAGYNYQRIEEQPFGFRIYKELGKRKWRHVQHETYK